MAWIWLPRKVHGGQHGNAPKRKQKLSSQNIVKSSFVEEKKVICDETSFNKNDID